MSKLDELIKELTLSESEIKISEHKDITFEELSGSVKNIHQLLYSSAVKAVNKMATIRNFLIGFYIVEYEQNGKDRANYGEKLLKQLEQNLQTKGLNETLFKNCRKFYLNYPQIKDFISGKSPTLSDKFTTPADKYRLANGIKHKRAVHF